MILELLDDAVLELEEQAAWYEERREGLGVEFLSEVRAALGLIVARPGVGSSLPTASTRRFALSSFPVAVVYLVEAELILVVALAHTRRRPDYWRRRLSAR